MSVLLIVKEHEGTEHSLRDTGTGRLQLRISNPCDDAPMFGRLDRAQALRVMDDLDELCNSGQATLVFMDDEAYVNYRHGL